MSQHRVYVCERGHRIDTTKDMAYCPARLNGVARSALVVCSAPLHGPFVDLAVDKVCPYIVTDGDEGTSYCSLGLKE